ncbi:hypothetical protein MRB53_004411 [Persea americana]|uniref:Uncharacterized protein n=1 Tax=Persea americana TaxID=3435 RepID=A0ACC2MB58_PERAE|nr:hypothetical protein MRB53_004411 [Persea americana]
MDEQSPPLDLKSLRAVSVLGRGAKGIAFLVRTESETLALKVISKRSIKRRKKRLDVKEEEEEKDYFRRIWFEREVLSSLHHPLLPKLRGFVVTEKIIGFGIEYCSGGNLSDLRKKQSEKMFSDDIIRFYAAELVHALEHLHGLGIVYRDLKPENVLIQENGHLMLVDFDLSKKLTVKPTDSAPIPSSESLNPPKTPNTEKKSLFRSFVLCGAGISRVDSAPTPENSGNRAGSGNSAESATSKSNSFVGTEDYVAPEVILGNGHDFAVDWWGLGVLLYELLYGKTPFRGSNRKETFNRIVTNPPDLVGEKTDLRDLIRKLVEKDPIRRISGEGVKRHGFFRGVDWERVLEISRPPFIPEGRLEEDEGMDGEDEGLDVEEYVEGVFKSDERGRGKSNGGSEKGVWADSLSNNNVDDESFWMF